MNKALTIDRNKTFLSLSMVASVVAFVFWATSAWSQVRAQVNQNTQSIEDTHQQIIDLRDDLKTTNENLIKTNENVVRLTTLLEKDQ